MQRDLETWGRVTFAGGFQAFDPKDFEGLVNCTSLGMQGAPAAEESCVGKATAFPEGFVVMDTVYAPRRTPLLRIAEAQGVPVVEGIEMFRLQAERQFASWTGSPAPPGLFDSLLGVPKSKPA